MAVAMIDKPKDDVANRLVELRKEHRLSQYEVAQIIGASITMYGRYERGRSLVNYVHLRALARLYGVTTDYILCLSEERRSPVEKKKRVSRSYIKGKWAELENYMSVILGEEGDPDIVAEVDVDRVKYDIRDYMKAICRELID